jgi:DNA-binding transcriptional MerR regulator
MDTLFSIGEAADILGISVPTLRLYEREGLIILIRKKSNASA